MFISEIEFLEWKENAVSKKFFENLKALREQIKEDLAHQLYANPEFACGKAGLAEQLIEMQYNDFMEKVSG